jgi:hypothetical protein
MFFKRKPKPKPTLVHAIHMANDTSLVAYKYFHDRNHILSEKELQLLYGLAEILFRNYSRVQRIADRMHQRARGEPEVT